jgi:outer membrane protein OmpA-like peptidoglycan-associated protein
MILIRSTLFILFILSVFLSTAEAAPKKYVDFMPKYRSEHENLLLTKISYTEQEMVIHFTYVSKSDNTLIQFSGAGTDKPWKLYSSFRSKNSANLEKLATLKNIVMNNKQEATEVAADESLVLNPKAGTILTGIAYFDRLPGNVKSINFAAGEFFICKDILIKDDRNPMLGTKEQMQANIDYFYDKMGVEVQRETLTIAHKEEEKDPVIERASNPVTYTPGQLRNTGDMKCNTRVNLRNVYFDDNSASYAGRVEALKTIQVIIQYMEFYPESSIILHGHSDVLGSPINNFELSKKRVLAVRNTLVTRGIDSDRIRYVAHGSSQPLPGKEKGSKKNRRVEVEVVCE